MKFFFQLAFLFLLVFTLNSCAGAASAQEYYSIGMAYFELGKYEEAERWLNRARSADRTMVASQYNLGRIAYEMRRYDEAVRHFEDILKRDPQNIFALRAAAYTRIKTGDINIAQTHYAKLLELVPESADDGYNHALVLFAMGRYADAETVLERYRLSFPDNPDTLLLYARTQAAQNKIEAINSFSGWLVNNSDAKVRYEYAQALEHHELYARAIEEYRASMSQAPASGIIKRSDIRFALARTLLIADSASGEGISELQTSINDGFDDIEAVEQLSNNVKISAASRNSIRNIANNMRQ
jgi:tetratricopeptide (TPR) repeat protein